MHICRQIWDAPNLWTHAKNALELSFSRTSYLKRTTRDLWKQNFDFLLWIFTPDRFLMASAFYLSLLKITGRAPAWEVWAENGGLGEKIDILAKIDDVCAWTFGVGTPPLRIQTTRANPVEPSTARVESKFCKVRVGAHPVRAPPRPKVKMYP